MEELCGIDTDVVKSLAIAYRTSLALCELLCQLLTQPVVASKAFGASPQVKAHRLREALKDFKIVVHSHRGVGYWLDDKTKARICKEANIDQYIRLRGVEMKEERQDNGDALRC